MTLLIAGQMISNNFPTINTDISQWIPFDASVSPTDSSCGSPLSSNRLQLNSQTFSPKSVSSYHTLRNLLATRNILSSEVVDSQVDPSIESRGKRRKGLPLRSPKASFDASDTPGIVFTWADDILRVIRQPLDYTIFHRQSATDEKISENEVLEEQTNVLPSLEIPSAPPPPPLVDDCANVRRSSGKKPPLAFRVCASCGVSKTPYWREAWDSCTVLCNACGLRYAKFKKRCLKCHYVPRKDDKGGRFCPLCSTEWS